MSPSTTSLLVLAAVIVLFVWNRLPVGVVAVLTSLTLLATGLVDAETALSGFGDPVVVFIASLFVVSEGIDATGVTTWAGDRLIALVGEGPTRLLVAVMLLCATLTALITLNGSVAALLPMVVVLAARIGRPSSQLLMPMVFTGSAGSLLLLTGSPINVIVSDAAAAADGRPFRFFEYALVGVPLVVVTVLVGVLLGPRLLPARAQATPSPDLSRHASRLAHYYELEAGFYRLRVGAESPFVGRVTPTGAVPGHGRLTLVGAQGPDGGTLPPEHVLHADDILVVTGEADEVSALVVEQHLAVVMQPLTTASGELMTREMGVSEVVVPPRSPLVGETVFPGQLRASDLVVLAVRRVGRDLGPRQVELEAGDALLLHGSWAAIDHLAEDRDVLLVDAPDVVRRQAVPLGRRSGVAIAVLLGMVVVLAGGWTTPAVVGLAAATLMVLLRVITPTQAYRAVSWQTVVLIAGLIPLSTAIRTSGAADLVASGLIDLVGAGRPYLLLVALFLLTAVIGQIISNTATVLIVVPIAVAAAGAAGVSVEPVLMLVAVAGAAALLTPIATPANMMVMGPAGYRFGDYWRLGVVVLVAWLAVCLVVIPLVWSF